MVIMAIPFLSLSRILRKAHFRALEEDLPAVRAIGINAAEDIHECGFTPAILTDQGMDFPGRHFQVDIVQGFAGPKYLEIFSFPG